MECPLWCFITLAALLSPSISTSTHDLIRNRLDEVLQEAVNNVLLSSTPQFKPPIKVIPDLPKLWNDSADHTTTVVREKRSYPSPAIAIPPIPEIGVGENDFFHEFVDHTGVGNREEIRVTGVREHPLHVSLPTPAFGWKYVRYNSSDIFLSLHQNTIHLWKINHPRGTPVNLAFDHRLSFCTIDVKHEGEVVLGEFITRLFQHVPVLRVAIVVRTGRNVYLLKTFEVTDFGCPPLTVSELRGQPKKLSVVATHYDSAEVILTEGPSLQPVIDFKQPPGSSRIIEVSTQQAIDMETFSLSGNTYIVIAHARGVEIGRFNEMLQHYMPFEHLPISGVIDISVFQMSFSQFLVVSTSHVSHHLFEFKGGSFQSRQTLIIPLVTAIHPLVVPTCRDDVLLVALRRDRQNPLLLFSWNGLRGEFVLGLQDMKKYIPLDSDIIPQSLVTFQANQSGFILATDTQNRLRLLSIETVLTDVPDPLFGHTLRTTNMMKNLQDRLVAQKQFIHMIGRMLDAAIRPISSHILHNPQIFRSLVANRPSIFKKIRELRQFGLQGSSISLADIKVRTDHLKDFVGGLIKELRSIETFFKNIAFKSQPTVMSGRNVISSIDAFSLAAHDVRLDQVMNMKAQDLINGIYNWKTPVPIFGRKFIPRVNIGSSFIGLINGIDLSRSVTTFGKNIIMGPVTFNQVNVHHHASVRAVNEVDLSRDIVRIDRGVFFLQSPVSFNQPIEIFGLFCGSIAGLDIKTLLQGILFTTGDQVLRSPLLINGKIAIGRRIGIRSLNGNDVQVFAQDLVRIDGPVTIIASKHFLATELLFTRPLIINGSINGLRIPADLFSRTLPQVIIAPKKLTGHHELRVVISEKSVDKIRLPDDVVSLSRQDSYPSLIFQYGFDIFKDIHDVRLVDTVDLNNLKLYGIRQTEGGGRLSNPIFNGPIIVRGNVDVSHDVNSLKLPTVVRDAVFPNDPPARFFGTKTFLKGINIPQGIRVSSINGINLNSHLVSTNGFDEVSRLNLFGAAFRNLSIKYSMVNGIDILNLQSRRISLQNPGFISGGKDFVNEFRSSSLSVEGRIQGVIPLQDFTLKSSNQHIPEPKVFKQVGIGGTLISGQMAVGLIDGVNLTRLTYQRVTLNSQQIMKMPAVIIQSRAGFLFAPSVNGLDLARVISNILMKNGGNQIITGSKQFISPVYSILDIETIRGVNGIRLPELYSRAVKRYGVNVISSNFTFVTPSLVTGRVVSRLINSFNLDAFVQEVLLKKSGHVIVNGHQLLINGFTVRGNVDTLSINGMYLPNHVLLRVANQTVTGNVTFRSPFVAKRDVLTRSINFISLSRFAQQVMMTNVPSKVAADLIFLDPVHVRGDIRVGGRVSGIKLGHLYRNTLFKTYDQFVAAEKTLAFPSLFQSDINLITLNNESFSEALQDIVFATGPPNSGRMMSHKTFKQVCIVHGNMVSVPKETVVFGNVRNVDLIDLALSTVFTNKPNLITGSKNFADFASLPRGLHVGGRINNLDVLNEAFFLIHPWKASQTLFDDAFFSKLIMTHPVQVVGRINGLNLSMLISDTLTSDGNQRIVGKKIILQPLTLANSTIYRFNSVSDFTREIVRLEVPNILSGRLTITQPIFVFGDTRVNGLINRHINVTELLLHSLTRNTGQLITGPIYFDNVVFVGDVAPTAKVNGILIRTFADDVFRFKNRIFQTERMVEGAMQSQSKKSNLAFDLLYESPLTADAVLVKQELRGVHGDKIEIAPSGEVIIYESDLHGINNTLHGVRFNRQNNIFDVYRVGTNIPLLQKINFQLQQVDFSIERLSFPESVVTQIRMRDRVIASLEPHIDDIAIFVKKPHTLLIATLIGVKGQIKIHSMNLVDNRVNLAPISILNVGPSATKMTLFSIEKKIHLAVSRSFRGQCSVTDFGSLLFELQDKSSFKLVQRLPVSDSNHVVYYDFNGEHYLAFSESNGDNLQSGVQSIQVFRRRQVSQCHFIPFQSLKFDNIRDLQVLSIGPHRNPQLILIAVNSTTVKFWIQDGHAGLTESLSANVKGGQKVTPLWIPDRGLFIFVAQDRDCRGSVVFQVKSKGATLQSIRMISNWSVIT